eukprot:jgi/Galph1/4003/GphlegSOOS_G2655.1
MNDDESEIEIVSCNTPNDHKRQGLSQESLCCEACDTIKSAQLLSLACGNKLCSSCVVRMLSDDNSNLRQEYHCPVTLCQKEIGNRDALKAVIYLFNSQESLDWYERCCRRMEQVSSMSKSNELNGFISTSSASKLLKHKTCYCGDFIEACCVEWEAEPDILHSVARHHCDLSRIVNTNNQIERMKRILEKEEQSGNIFIRKNIHKEGTNNIAKQAFHILGKRKSSSGTGFGGDNGEHFHQDENLKKRREFIDNVLSSALACLVVLLQLGNGPYPLFLSTFIYKTNLLRYLTMLLRNNSVYDVCSRIDLYSNLFRLLSTFSNHVVLQPLLFFPVSSVSKDNLQEEESQRCLADLLKDFEENIYFLQKSLLSGKVEISQAESLFINKVAETCASIRSIRAVYQRFIEEITHSKDNFIEKPSKPEQSLTLSTLYCEQLRKGQFAILHGLSSCHSFKHHVSFQYHLAAKGRMSRLVKEVSSLGNDLPLSYGSSIIVRVDDQRYDIFRVLIFGPEDTPYANGAFFFDFLLPEEYPEKPPLAKFLTTRNGEIRCNPNLYSCGKICLSLLGTWQGPSWTKDCTLLQVLVSIQSLIFVNEPYLNEPAFENMKSTRKGKENSMLYNLYVEDYTVKYGMLDVLKKPFPGFEQIIRKHFLLKRDKIIQQVEEWREKALRQRTVDYHSLSPLEASSSKSKVTCGVSRMAMEELRRRLNDL